VAYLIAAIYWLVKKQLAISLCASTHSRRALNAKQNESGEWATGSDRLMGSPEKAEGATNQRGGIENRRGRKRKSPHAHTHTDR